MFAHRWWSPLGLTLLALALTGCGSKNVKVHGKVLKDGKPMVVSEDTYVTVSFVPEGRPAAGTADPERSSYSAKFEPKSGSYTVQLPPGQYRTMLIVAPPKGKAPPGKVSAPAPVRSPKSYDLTRDQELDIEGPAR